MQSNFDANNGRVMITKYGRAAGLTETNLSTFHPPGAAVHAVPASASVRGPVGNNNPTGSGNKLTQGTKTPGAPLTSGGTSATGGANTTTSLLKKH